MTSNEVSLVMILDLVMFFEMNLQHLWLAISLTGALYGPWRCFTYTTNRKKSLVVAMFLLSLSATFVHDFPGGLFMLFDAMLCVNGATKLITSRLFSENKSRRG